MPDRHGFNLLGETVRCIDCDAGGPIWRWPERKRRRHARTHRPERRRSGRDLRWQRVLLAAPPTTPHEEKEGTTMTKQSATEGQPAKQVAIDVLRKAGEPLHAKEIAKRVLASGRTRLTGKTPEQTITAMLAVGSKPGGPFKRVDKGTCTLAAEESKSKTRGRTGGREANKGQRRRPRAKPAV
jgi:HB1, ASXL, restriction endonuclease HTH domain